MEQFKPPECLSLEGNVAENWRKWRQRFQIYLEATEADAEDEKRQCSIFLYVIGEEALEVFNTFTFDRDADPSESRDKLSTLYDKFQKYCDPRKNITFERHKFFTRSQKPDETIDQYVTDLKLKSRTCEFGELRDSLIKDRVVCGICSDQVRERLLRDPELTLQKAIDTCRAAEVTKAQMKNLTEEEKTVHVVRQKQQSAAAFASDSQAQRTEKTGQQKIQCTSCGYKHFAQARCPAMGKTCLRCGGADHFRKVCTHVKKKVSAMETEDPSSDEELLLIGAVTAKQASGGSDWFADLKINKKTVRFKLDTGAQANVLPETMYTKVANAGQPLRSSKTKLCTYSGEQLQLKGKCTLNCRYKDSETALDFLVVDVQSTPVLGLETCEQLDLIQRVMTVSGQEPDQACSEIVQEYDDVFQGLGCLGVEYKIKLRDDAVPVIHAPRRVPVALMKPLREELDRMIDLGVIEKVEEPTEWVSSLVVVQKANGKLRLCLDPKDLNKYVMREHYYIPVASEVTREMTGAQYFSKLDASSGFWQIPLTKECTRLTTFNTPFGRYCFRRLPFGIASASEVFHRTVQQIFEGLPGVRSIHDDIIVWGKDRREHDERLRIVLDKARKANLKLGRGKCQFAVPSLTYMGEQLSPEGVQPDPEKVAAVVDMPTPTCKADLQRALGMVNYMGKFIPNLSSKTTSLRSLLEARTDWQWSHEHNSEWAQL